MVAHVANHVFGTANGDRRLGSDLAGDLEHASQQFFLAGIGAVDQVDALRLGTVDGAAGKGQLTHHAVADDARQALQGADIGRHAHVDFLDGELRIDGGVAHVAGRDQVDRAAQAVALDRRQYRLAAVVDGIEGGLQLEDLAAQSLGVAAHVLAKRAARLGQQHQVDTRGKMLAGAGKDHHAHLIGVVDPAEDVDYLGPEIRVHRVHFFRAIDLHMGDLVDQLDAESFVFGHADHPRRQGAPGCARICCFGINQPTITSTKQKSMPVTVMQSTLAKLRRILTIFVKLLIFLELGQQ